MKDENLFASYKDIKIASEFIRSEKDITIVEKNNDLFKQNCDFEHESGSYQDIIFTNSVMYEFNKNEKEKILNDRNTYI